MMQSKRGQPSASVRAIALVASLAAAVLLGLACLKLFFAIVTPLQAPSTGSRQLAEGRPALDVDTSILARADLFALTGDMVSVHTEEVLPETTLRLVLKSASPTPGGVSGAVIQVANGKQQYFRESEEIMRGVTLTRVETWRVVITRNGVREALTLKNRPERDGAAEIFATPGDADVAAPSVEASNVTLPDGIDDIGAQATLRSLAGPLLSQLESQGFQGDDVPVAIDGKPIPADSAGLQQLMAQARLAGAVTVTVARDGRAQDIRFTLP